METPTVPEDHQEKTSASEVVSAEPNFDRQLTPITEFVARPDFPGSLQGEFVDIGGYTGIVIEITSKSIRVKSPEETTRSFNIHVLRKLYGPPQHPEPISMPRAVEPPAPLEKKDDAQEPMPMPDRDIRELIAEPNFDRSPKPITDFASRLDFPACAYGEFVEVARYTGVVVQVANESVKVQSPQGIVRSYGVSTLRKLFGRR
ncbi:MAG: hypothetical protein FJ403_13035 [Verrucomicrobia bacterium]|nr:hypothetical protein [Verrucomicrobiota bacterium]